MNKPVIMKIINTEKAPKAIGPYSQAVVAGEFIFCSGQIGLNVDGVLEGDVKGQTRKALKNIKEILTSADADISNIVKMTVYMSDIKMFNDMNSEYGFFFKEIKPARSTVEVSNLPKGALIEMECIAKIND